MRGIFLITAMTLAVSFIATGSASADAVIDRAAAIDAPSGRAAPTQSSTGPYLPRRVASNAAF